MCRHLGYLGRPRRLGGLLADPPSALVRQSWAPRRQTHGIMNVDGFGAGWYVDGDPEPARHRGSGPIWADETFADLARTVRSGAFLAAVRSATAGMPPGAGAAAPFRSGRWLFSHNGALPGWPQSASDLAKSLAPERLLRMDAPTDSALLWALLLERLERGAALADAVAAVARQARPIPGGRLNLLATDGASIAATALGASLCVRDLGDGAVVASEPYDDEPGWRDVPEGSLVTVRAESTDAETDLRMRITVDQL
jgi:glutamine amidotransferase